MGPAISSATNITNEPLQAEAMAVRIEQVRECLLKGQIDAVYEQIQSLLAQAADLPGALLQLRLLALQADLRRGVRPQLDALAELRALELQACELGEPRARVDVHLVQATTKFARCLHVSAMEEVVAALELCVRHDLRATLMRAVEVQGRMFVGAGMFKDGMAYAQTWLAHRPSVPIQTQISMWSLLGTAAYFDAEESGNPQTRARSVHAHDQALALSRGVFPSLQAASLINLTIGCAKLGDQASAEQHLAELQRLIEGPREALNFLPVHWAWLALCEGLVQFGRGQLQSGLAALVAGREAAQAHRSACLPALIKIQELLLMHPDPSWGQAELQDAVRELARLHQAQTSQQQELSAKGFEEMVRAAELGGENRVLRQHGDELTRELAQRNQALGETVAELRAQVQRRERAEAALQQAHDQLELRVIERTEQLQVAGLALAQHERMAALARLVAGVAHRLNTPLGNARMAVSSLTDGVGAFAAKLGAPMKRQELGDFVGLCRDASALADHALTQASDLMQVFKQVSTLEHAEAARDFDAAATTRQVAHVIAVSLGATDLPLRLELPEQAPCFGFPQVFAQVLKQLLANAYQHGQPSPAQGLQDRPAPEAGVWLRLTLLDDELHLLVRDQGPGLAASQLERIFDPFNSNLNGSSLGLGLHIARNLATDLLHGQLRASSTLGQGCSFSLQMPRRINA
ncbi:MAG: HAMP domain-containing histidine kinase [Paucibacter sp.]|nr:HAMP domain-containing histidine kinase [Roseateles sp.]